MITVPLHVYAHCERCGARAVALSINVRYAVNDQRYRANKVHPCECLLGIEDVTDGDPAPTRHRNWYRRRRVNVL